MTYAVSEATTISGTRSGPVFRSFLRKTYDLAQHVTHSDSVNRAQAYAVAAATLLLIRAAQQLHVGWTLGELFQRANETGEAQAQLSSAKLSNNQSRERLQRRYSRP